MQRVAVNLITPTESALWASEYLGKKVTSSNILYLLNYGKIANHNIDSKENLIDKNELKAYYDSTIKANINLASPLSFAEYKEAETTKHIHRLHPYKGKFIPQLVEYFLDSHTDNLKLESCFQQGDIILDPFCGSGTTLCVANELNIHAIGIDISIFNTILSNAKVQEYDVKKLEKILSELSQKLESYIAKNHITDFENELNTALSEFNNLYFPVKTYKRKVALKEIDEKTYGKEKEELFLNTYEILVKKYHINLETHQGNFFDKWYIESIKNELLFLKNEILKYPKNLQDILMIILSRTARSCRATTHADLATLKEPILKSYYCKKHGRICKPLFSINKWWKTYAKDTLKRLQEFQMLKSDKIAICLNADSQNVNIFSEVEKHNENFSKILRKQKIAGIFSSPPYVGLIDYHEQHAYAYEIFDLPRKDSLEIGKKKCGQSKVAQEKYIQGIAKVLQNAKPFLKQDYNIFLVANDKFNLYPKIAALANMEIVKKYDRPVLNRSEKDTNEYSESIFHLKERGSNAKS